MSGYKSFAVAGAGNIGKFIVEALLERKVAGEVSSVSVLSRSSSGQDDLVAKGAKLITVEYTSSSSLESALSGVDVVISALNLHAVGVQDGLATSAKAAGVKLFVPSEFGSDTHGRTDNPLFKQKEALKEKLKELELPYAVFYTGLFTDQVFAPNYSVALGFDFAKGEISIPGSGTAAISWTTRTDVAQFVAYVLTALSRDKIEGRTFRIEGERTTLNQVAADWEARSGKTIVVSHRPRSQFEEALKKNPSDFFTFFILQLDSGKVDVGNPGELANGEFAKWKPKKVIDVLLENFGQ